MINVAKA